MTASDPSPLPPSDRLFLSYLVALLSVYELGPDTGPLPAYDGPSDRQSDAIILSLASVIKRMYQAEAHARNEAQEVSLFTVFAVCLRFTMASRLVLNHPRRQAPEVFFRSGPVPS